MRTTVQDKYFLRDVHREIDLYDRKIVHLVKHEQFATDVLRDAAIRKLSTKREALVVTARELMQNGIEFSQHELPRSLRPEGWVDGRETAAADMEASASVTATAVAQMTGGKPGATRLAPAAPASDFGAQVARLQQAAAATLREEAPLAAALGSWQDDLLAYKKKRRKSPAAA